MLAFLFLLFTGNQLYEMRRDMCFDVRPLLHTHTSLFTFWKVRAIIRKNKSENL